MSYLTVKDASKYVTYKQFEEFYLGIEGLEDLLVEKLTGGEETPENSTPILGDIAIISANYDTSFFIRWDCKDPRGRKLKFFISVNDSDYIFVNPWFNGNNYTCFIPKGMAKVGTNNCKIYADNQVYQTSPKPFTVEIPKVHVPTPPTISQDIQNISGKPGAVVTIRYTASDDGIIRYHEFYNGAKLIDITDRVIQNGTTYEYMTSWTSAISIQDAYIKVKDNENLSSESNKFKIIIT